MAFIFQKLASKGMPAGIDKNNVLQSRDWFRSIAQRVTSVDVSKFQSEEPKRLESAITSRSIGKMYSFFYDAKNKSTLPYWDRFPLVFPIEIYDDGFLGINLHYLPHKLRAKLMDALYNNINNNKLNETTKIVLSYKILAGSSRYSYFKPCVKRYLTKHVRSKFMYISPREWDMALMLPTEKFVGASTSYVHSESSKMVSR